MVKVPIYLLILFGKVLRPEVEDGMNGPRKSQKLGRRRDGIPENECPLITIRQSEDQHPGALGEIARSGRELGKDAFGYASCNTPHPSAILKNHEIRRHVHRDSGYDRAPAEPGSE